MTLWVTTEEIKIADRGRRRRKDNTIIAWALTGATENASRNTLKR